MIYRRQVVWNPSNIALISLTFSSIVRPAIIFSPLPVSFTRSPLKRMLRRFDETLVFHPISFSISRILLNLVFTWLDHKGHLQVLTSFWGHI